MGINYFLQKVISPVINSFLMGNFAALCILLLVRDNLVIRQILITKQKYTS